MKYIYAQSYSLQHCLLLQNIRNDLDTSTKNYRKNYGTSTQWNNM